MVDPSEMTPEQRQARMDELYLEIEDLEALLQEAEDEYSALETFEDEEESEEEPEHK